MSGGLTEDEVRELIRDEVDGGRSIGKLPKLFLATTLLLAVIAIPVLGDVNIRDTGDLVLRDDTGLDLKGSTIDNVGAPQDSDDAVNKNYVDSNLGGSSGESAESKCSNYEVLNGYGQCVEVQYDEPKDSGKNNLGYIYADTTLGGGGDTKTLNLWEADDPTKTGYYNLTFDYRIAAYDGIDRSSAEVSIFKLSSSNIHNEIWNKRVELDPRSTTMTNRSNGYNLEIRTYLDSNEELEVVAKMENGGEDNNYAEFNGTKLDYTGEYKPVPPN